MSTTQSHTRQFVCFWRASPQWARASSITAVLDQTQRRTTVGRTPLEGCSARRRDLYLATHNTHNWQTSVSPVGFEPTISASERPQPYALDRAATETGHTRQCNKQYFLCDFSFHLQINSVCFQENLDVIKERFMPSFLMEVEYTDNFMF